MQIFDPKLKQSRAVIKHVFTNLISQLHPSKNSTHHHTKLIPIFGKKKKQPTPLVAGLIAWCITDGRLLRSAGRHIHRFFCLGQTWQMSTNCSFCRREFPPGNEHIPPWEKANHLQNAIFGGYVSSLDGNGSDGSEIQTWHLLISYFLFVYLQIMYRVEKTSEVVENGISSINQVSWQKYGL